MAPTVSEPIDSTECKKWVALVLQSELLLTDLADQCPLYLACRV